MGMLVLENCSASLNQEEELEVITFTIIFSDDQDRHVFSCLSVNQAQNWVAALRHARCISKLCDAMLTVVCTYCVSFILLISYEHLRIQVKLLESKLECLGGKVRKFKISESACQRLLNALRFNLLIAQRINNPVGNTIMANHISPVESKPSSILSLDENDQLFKLIGLRCKVSPPSTRFL
jgi:hypothetical protein